jgi:HEAT repeat protein
MSYSFSYAPTNRASCKGKCKEKIEKDAIRLGTATDGAGDYQMVSYRCVPCITKKQFDNIAEKLGSVEDVPGFLTLKPEDQQKVKDAAASALSPPKPAKNAKTTAGSSSSTAPTAPAAPAAPPLPPLPTISEQHTFADAAKRHDWPTVKSLLETDPGYINVQPAGRWTALHQFAQAGNAEAVNYLLSKGADEAAKTKEGKTPLQVAHSSVAALLSGAGGGAATIPLAEQHKFCDYAKECDFEQVKLLIEATPGLVNVQPAQRWSALHQAAAAGDKAMVKWLLAKGADRKSVNRDGETPLDVADGACKVLLGGKRSAADSDGGDGDGASDAKKERLDVDPLVRTLTDAASTYGQRCDAVKALEALGPAAGTAGGAALLAVIEHPGAHDDARLRALAATALGKLDAAAGPFVAGALATRDAFEDPMDMFTTALDQMVNSLGPAVCVRPLGAAIEDSAAPEATRVQAARAMALLGAGAAPRAETLAAALRDPVADVRMGAARALGEIGDDQYAEPLVRALAEDDNAFVRWDATDALSKLSTEAVARHVDALAALAATPSAPYDVDSSDEEEEAPELPNLTMARVSAVKLLATTGEAAEPHLGTLATILGGGEAVPEGVRAEAARALGTLGASAPLALAARNDPSGEVRSEAREALGKIQVGPDASDAGALARTLADTSRSDEERGVAAAALGKLGAAASCHVPALGALLLNSDVGFFARMAAAEAIGSIGGGEAYLEDILEQGDEVDEGIWIACQTAHGGW